MAVARLLVSLVLLATTAGCTSGASGPSLAGETVTVIGSWEGSELAAFRAVTAPWEATTGAHVDYIATRDLTGVLRQRVAAGNPPDLAGLAGPGQMAELARAGALRDLAGAIDIGRYKAETAPTFVELGTIDSRLVGVFIRSSVKGLLWYDPEVVQPGAPQTWEDLQRLIDRSLVAPTRPWCVGLASAESSGWPGTDWIEDFLLRQSGPLVYDAWVAGQLSWSSPEVRRAFESYGAIVVDASVAGGASAAIATAFGSAGTPLFADPPGCLFTHQASFMASFLAADGRVAGRDFDFIPFPDINPAYAGSVIGAGDLVGLFTDRPAARALIRYLVSAEAQSTWVAQGGTLSVNNQVSDYPDPVSARAAEVLHHATRFRFDASDLMPEPMSHAFLRAVLEFTADQRGLTSILQQLDAVRATAYRS